MRIVYDLVTSLVFPSALNGARRANADIPGSSGEAEQHRAGRSSDPTPMVAGARIGNLPVERFARAQMPHLTGGMERADQNLRRALFMETITVLREGDEPASDDPKRGGLARPDLMIGDGIPLELQPLEITFGHRTAAHLAALAERQKERREAPAQVAIPEAGMSDRSSAGIEAIPAGLSEHSDDAPGNTEPNDVDPKAPTLPGQENPPG